MPSHGSACRTTTGLGNGPCGLDGVRRHAAHAADAGASEQQISDALLLSYNGVYAAPPSSPTLYARTATASTTSQTFTYKLVRTSPVITAVVRGPADAVSLAQDAEQPGVHTVQWDGARASEGDWRFVVSGLDDTGRTTSAEQRLRR